MYRKYERYGNDLVNGLSINFGDEQYYVLTSFLTSEVSNFSEDILEVLRYVLLGIEKTSEFSGNGVGIEVTFEKTEVYFNFAEDIMPESCFIATRVLYNLVLEWIEMEKKYKAGELQLPIELID